MFRPDKRWLAWSGLGAATALAVVTGVLALGGGVRSRDAAAPPEPPVARTPSVGWLSPSPPPVPPARSAATGTVPQVVHMRLPEAEAALAGAGFTAVRTVDATGQGRVVIERNNWVVASQDPPAGTAAPAGTMITLAVRRPTDGIDRRAVTTGVVPDVVCLDLQAAQDALRSAGFYVITPKDGAGRARIPLIDRDWVVILQSVPAGTRPGLLTHVTLTVVRLGEPTGTSGCAS